MTKIKREKQIKQKALKQRICAISELYYWHPEPITIRTPYPQKRDISGTVSEIEAHSELVVVLLIVG